MGDDELKLSSEVFSLWVLDWKAREARIVLQNGEQITEAMESSMVTPSDQIAVSTFDWDRWWVGTLTTRGHLFFSEVWSPVGDPVKGRPSVYLDQNHWSTVAKSRVRPNSLPEADLVAANRIVDLAMDGGIRLPVSSATLSETAGLFGDRRYEVGVAIASLSGGWQLRDPIEVRKQEFADWFSERLGLETSMPVKDIVTLEPRSIFGERIAPNAHEWANADVRLLLDAITWPSVLASTLLDPELTVGQPPERWAQVNQRISEGIAALGQKQRLSATNLAAINDNRGLLSEALATLGDPAPVFARLTTDDLVGAVTEPRFGGLYTEMMARRLRDRGRRWVPNDLNDVMFLTCAAAYCEYVVAERATGRQLTQVLTSRGVQPNVFVTLPELVEALHRDNVVTVTEAQNEGVADVSTDGSS